MCRPEIELAILIFIFIYFSVLSFFLSY